MQTELSNVTGMTRGGGINSVTQALTAVSGVSNVNVSLAGGEATVEVNERLTSPEQQKSAVRGAGDGVNGPNTAQNHQG